MNLFYSEPPTLDEVIELKSQYGSAAALLAGGTALLVDMRHGELEPSRLVSLAGIPTLRAVELNGGLQIGAMATITELAETLKRRDVWRGLLEACWNLGPLQIQNLATVGGNICKASPGADMVPPLLCLDAQLELAGEQGTRMTPLDGFLTGPDQTALQPSEVLTMIHIPTPSRGTGTAFFKMMRRQAVDCSIVAVSALVQLAPDGQTCHDVRIAIGAAAPHPFRATRAEAALCGSPLTRESVRAVAQIARDESRPISDVRASADYRLKLVETLVERALWRAAERATTEGTDNR